MTFSGLAVERLTTCRYLSLDSDMNKLPPMVTLRSLREAHGLDSRQMAERLREQGVTVHPDHLLNVELGHKRGSRQLMAGYARVLGIKAVDIRQADELVDTVTALQDAA